MAEQILPEEELPQIYGGGLEKCKFFIDEVEAGLYYDEFKLQAHYRCKLEDGTDRRYWELRDPDGDISGFIITAIKDSNTSIPDSVWKDSFDFMEITITLRDFESTETTQSPRTAHYINKELEEDNKNTAG